MFGAFTGSILIVFGLMMIGYTIYAVIVHPPINTAEWVFSAFYIVGGLIIAYFGYKTLYPPPMMFPPAYGGRRR